MLSAPLRDRFGLTYHLDYYNEKDIQEIAQRSAKILAAKIDSQAASELAKRSRFTPRIANRLLRRVRDDAAFAFGLFRDAVQRDHGPIL